MWNFIKTSLSVLGLFIIIVLLVGLYSALVQEPGEEKEDNHQAFPDNSTTTDSATTSDFIDVGSDESILEDIPTY